jgi:hypothetical protein
MKRLKAGLEEVIQMSKALHLATALAVVAAAAAGILTLGCDEADAKAGKEVMDLIRTLEVGEPVHYGKLTIIPVYSTCIRDRSPYTTLDEALGKGWLEITEMGSGSVPQVVMTNRSARHIFIMGGEVLTGCRQDRLVGRDVLLRPHAREVLVPVYCVEQGRWTYESETFYSRENLGTPGLRAEGQKASDAAQSEIWDRVSTMCERSGAETGSRRYQAAYESDEAKREISDYESRMKRIPTLYPDAVGVVIGVGSAITSVDVFANPQVFRELWPKILKSSAMAAILRKASGSVSQNDAVRFLRTLHNRHYVRRPAIDLGEEHSAADGEVNVNALVYGGAVIHMAAFPEPGSIWSEKASGDSERRIKVLRR